MNVIRFDLSCNFVFQFIVKFWFIWFLRMCKILQNVQWKVQCFPHINTQTGLFLPQVENDFSKFQMRVIIRFIVIFFYYYHWTKKNWTNCKYNNNEYWKLLWMNWRSLNLRSKMQVMMKMIQKNNKNAILFHQKKNKLFILFMI